VTRTLRDYRVTVGAYLVPTVTRVLVDRQSTRFLPATVIKATAVFHTAFVDQGLWRAAAEPRIVNVAGFAPSDL